MITLGNRVVSLIRHDRVLRRVLENSAWLLSSSSINTGLLFVQGIFIARMLGVEKFGVFALITSFTNVVNQFMDSRAWETAIQFITKFTEKGDYRKATAVAKLCYLVDAVTGALGCAVVILAAELAARLFIKDVSTAYLIRFYALSLLIQSPVGTSSALLRVGNRFSWLAYQHTFLAGSRLLGSVVVLAAGWDLFGLLAMYLVTDVLGTLLIVIMSLKVRPALGLMRMSQTPLAALRGEFRELLRFLATTNLHASFKVLQNNLPVLLVGYWLTSVEAGYFQLARKIVNLMTIPMAPLTISSYPEFARLWHSGNTMGLKRLLGRLTAALTTTAVVALGGLCLAASWLVPWTVGDEYLPAVPVIYWMAAGMAIAVAANSAGPFLVALGRVGNTLAAISLSTIGQLALLAVLLPRIGILAAGISYLFFYLIWLIVISVSVRSAYRTQLA
ncbi:MAG: lipopolysaccharide biosynthesis protein [Pirellulales bacterium]